MILQCIGKNFVVTVLDEDRPNAPSLIISRVTTDIRIGERVPPPAKEGSRPLLRIYGILGFVQLLAGRYLVVISEREYVGKVRDQAVYKIMRTNILSFAPDLEHVAPVLRKQEKKFIVMLQTVLQTPFHYFSYSYDLTQSVQRIQSQSEEEAAKPMWLRADKRFFWNYAMLGADPPLCSTLHLVHCHLTLRCTLSLG